MMDRLRWALIGRFLEINKTQNFKASIKSYANKNCQFGGNNRLYGASHIVDSHLGRYTYLAGARVTRATIGAFCSIGPGAIVGGLSRHPVDFVSTHPVFYSLLKQVGITFSDDECYRELGEVIIGNDVWIGANALILDDVSIGDGAVIGAGSVVTKDIDPYAIVGGCPAKLIRYRFDKEQINKLMTIKWWNFSDTELRKYSFLFRNRDISDFINHFS